MLQNGVGWTTRSWIFGTKAASESDNPDAASAMNRGPAPYQLRNQFPQFRQLCQLFQLGQPQPQPQLPQARRPSALAASARLSDSAETASRTAASRSATFAFSAAEGCAPPGSSLAAAGAAAPNASDTPRAPAGTR